MYAFDSEEKEGVFQLLGHIIDESINEIYVFAKESLRFTYVNKAAQQNLGYTLDEMKNMTPLDLKPKLPHDAFAAMIGPLLDHKEKEAVFETVHRRKDGSDYPVEVHLQLIRTGSRELFVAIVLDITRRKRSEHQKEIMEHRAYHDSLTGLPNRTLLLDRLDQAIKTAHRGKSKLAVMFIDLDHFKEINDTLGHQYGDAVLVEVARRLSDTIRESDTLARLGGDEFTLIVEGISEAANAEEIAQKLIQAVKTPFLVKDRTLHTTLSIGIALYPADGTRPYTLLDNADTAMYKAKNEERGTYRFYTEDITDEAFERIVMETGLRHAIEHDEFVVYYQPQFDGQNDTIIGMEALVRWQHSKLGLVSPAQFIPLAEETGLMVRLDRWVMKVAMRQIAAWHKEGLSPGVLSLNMTMKQLFEKDFIAYLQATLDKSECKPEWVELEINEDQAMRHPEETLERFRQISDLGIRLVIDNFGTGRLSMSYLERLPVSKLKIDRSFIKNVPNHNTDDTVVEALIGLCKSMKMEIMAEGVETGEQKAYLVEHGCSRIQGYFCGKPVSADEMKKALKRAASK